MGLNVGILAGLGNRHREVQEEEYGQRKNILSSAAETWSHIASNPNLSPEAQQHAVGMLLLAGTADPHDAKSFKTVQKQLSDLTPIQQGVQPQVGGSWMSGETTRKVEAQPMALPATIPDPNAMNVQDIQRGGVPELGQPIAPMQTPPAESYTIPVPQPPPQARTPFMKSREQQIAELRQAGQVKADIAAAEDEAKYKAQQKYTKPQMDVGTINEGDWTYDKTTGKLIAQAGKGKPKGGTGDFQQIYLPAFAAKLGKTIDTLSPEETMQATHDYATKSQDPEMRDLLEQQRRNAVTLQQLQMGQMPTKDDVEFYADQLVNHRMAPSQIPAGMGVQGQAFRRNVEIAALKKNRDFNMQEAEAEFGLVKSPAFQQQIRFIDHVNNTLPRLEAAAKKLGNTSVKGLNALLTKGQEQFGGTNIKVFLADRDIVANELGRVLSGGGTGNQTSDVKIAAAQRLVSETDSPSQIAATLAEIRPLLRSRRATLTHGTYLADIDTSAEIPSPAPAGETTATINGVKYRVSADGTVMGPVAP